MHNGPANDMNDIRDTPIQNEKKTTRTLIRNSIARMNPQQRRKASEAAAGILMNSQGWKEAGCVLAYLAFGTEMNTDRLIAAALRSGKALFVPRVDGKTMSFHRIYSDAGPFERGVFGIRQPSAENEEWVAGKSGGRTLVVVPGMAFDASGGRLGRGGAYYDRFIAECRAAAGSGEIGSIAAAAPAERNNSSGARTEFIAFAYSCQIIDSVPRDDSDETVDGIVSEKGLIATPTKRFTESPADIL